MPDPILMRALARMGALGAAPADATATRKPAPEQPLILPERHDTIGPRHENIDQYHKVMQRAAERSAGAEELQNSAVNLLSMTAPAALAPAAAEAEEESMAQRPKRRIAADSLFSAMPKQEDLLRYKGARIKPAQLDEVYNLTRGAIQTPEFQQRVGQGQQLLGDRFWYDSRGLRQKALEGHEGDEGAAQKSVDDLANMMAASTALGAVPHNLQRGSLWRALNDRQMLDPEELRSGQLVPVPEGFGHFTQRTTQQPAIADVVEHGALNSLKNPKPASFASNIRGNFRPATLDTRMSDMLLHAEPRLVGAFNTGQNHSPKDWAYAPLEHGFQDEAQAAAKRGDLSLLPGADPTAILQERAWTTPQDVAGGDATLEDVFDRLLGKSAKLWHVAPSEANRLFWKERQPLMLPLGAPLLRGR